MDVPRFIPRAFHFELCVVEINRVWRAGRRCVDCQRVDDDGVFGKTYALW